MEAEISLLMANQTLVSTTLSLLCHIFDDALHYTGFARKVNLRPFYRDWQYGLRMMLSMASHSCRQRLSKYLDTPDDRLFWCSRIRLGH